MKKKRIIILCSLIILAVLIILTKNFVGTYPFKQLKAEEIKNVSVWVIPPDITIELTEEETEELVYILNNVKIYNRSWKHMFSGGQSCIFTITLEQQLENINKEIAEREEELKKLREKRKEITTKIEEEKKEALYKAVIASGKTIEEVLAAITDKQEEIA